MERAVFLSVLLALVLFLPPLALPLPWHQTFATYVHAIVLEAFPFLILGALIAAAVERFLPADALGRLSRRMGPWALPGTALLTPLLPVCECGVVVVVRGLLSRGLPLPQAVTFLLAAPILNPVVLFTTWLAFHDVRYPVCRAFGGLAIALVVGYVVARLRPEWVLKPALLVAPPPPPPPTVNIRGGAKTVVRSAMPAFTLAPGGAVRVAPVALTLPGWRGHIGAISTQTLTHVLDMLQYFLVGVLIASAFKTFVGAQVLNGIGDGLVTGPLALMGGAVVLSLCAEADAFVCASFTEFSFHSHIAFLVLGPMLDLKLLLMYRAVFTGRFIVLLSALLIAQVFVYALLLGVAAA